jgi:hypothetical protein
MTMTTIQTTTTSGIQVRLVGHGVEASRQACGGTQEYATARWVDGETVAWRDADGWVTAALAAEVDAALRVAIASR